MPIFKNHRGQFHKMNTALVALTSLYVIGAAVALSSPYWASSYPILAPLATFATTPIGMGILAFVAVALIGLAVYTIRKNNEVSEEKAPKITKDGLLARRDVYEEMKKNNQVKNNDGNVVQGQYYMDFSLNSKDYRVIVGDQFKEQGNTLILKVSSLEVKGDDGKYALASDKPSATLGLTQQGDEVNTYLGKLSSVQPAASQGPGKQ